MSLYYTISVLHWFYYLACGWDQSWRCSGAGPGWPGRGILPASPESSRWTTSRPPQLHGSSAPGTETRCCERLSPPTRPPRPPRSRRGCPGFPTGGRRKKEKDGQDQCPDCGMRLACCQILSWSNATRTLSWKIQFAFYFITEIVLRSWFETRSL